MLQRRRADEDHRVYTPSTGIPGPVDVQVTTPHSAQSERPDVPADVYTYVAPSAYAALAVPLRICDTRPSMTHIGCTSVPVTGRPLGSNGTVVVQITGVVGRR